jgi:hypothetical protein
MNRNIAEIMTIFPWGLLVFVNLWLGLAGVTVQFIGALWLFRHDS